MTHAQVAHTYLRMATEAHYRPAAPSDGFGNITTPLRDLDIDDEAKQYASRFMADEDEQQFHIGYPDYPGRPALVLLIEAARLVCGVEPAIAAQLARMAADDLERAYRVQQ